MIEKIHFNLAGNLNLGFSYLITTVNFNLPINNSSFTCIGFETRFALTAVKNGFYQKFSESLDKMESWI